MNTTCTLPRIQENEQAAQAADFAAAQMAQSVTWARLEWWHTSAGVNLMAVTPACNATNTVTQVGELFGRGAA